MPYDISIPGQVSEAQLRAIEAVASLVPSGGCVVEVGSLFGRSSWAWAKSVHQSVEVVCIDPWEGNEGIRSMEAHYGIKYGLEQFTAYTKDCPNIRPIQAYSPSGVRDWTKPVDLYYEDAVHVDPVLSQNIAFWTSKLTKYGIVCGDDYRPRFPHVRAAAERCANQVGRPLHVVDFFWCVLPDASLVPGVESVASLLAELGAQRRAEQVAKGAAITLHWKATLPTELPSGDHTFRYYVANDGIATWPAASGGHPVGIGVRVTPWDDMTSVLREHMQALPVTRLAYDLPAEDDITLPLSSLPPGDYAIFLDLIGPDKNWANSGPHGAHLSKIRLGAQASHSALSGRHYELGSSIDFSVRGTGERYKISGWVGAEKAFSWCHGSQSTLEMHISGALTAADYDLGIRLRPLVAPSFPSQRMTIQANGTDIFQGELNAPATLSIRLPKESLATGILRIVLRHPDARRPMDLFPDSKDAKLLAFAVEELRIDEVTPISIEGA